MAQSGMKMVSFGAPRIILCTEQAIAERIIILTSYVRQATQVFLQVIDFKR